MDLEHAVKSKNFKVGVGIVAGILILLVVFGAGVFVGLEKAKFSYRWGENYFRNFGGHPGPGRFFPDRDYLAPHGSDGQILKIDNNTITIKGRDGIEKNIIVLVDTAIKNGREDIKVSDLKINDYIVVIGSPNDKGEIDAKLIRTVPPPPQ